MSALRVGQRIKKVRGAPENVGDTGLVVKFAHDGYMIVRLETMAIGDILVYMPGDEARTLQDEWEPILPDGHKPCEEDFKRDLDRLLEREGVAA